MGYTMEDYKDYEKLADEERKGYATKPALVEKIEYPMTIAGAVRFHGRFLKPHQPHRWRKRKGILLLGAGMDSGTGLRLGNTGILKIHDTIRDHVETSGQIRRCLTTMATHCRHFH